MSSNCCKCHDLTSAPTGSASAGYYFLFAKNSSGNLVRNTYYTEALDIFICFANYRYSGSGGGSFCQIGDFNLIPDVCLERAFIGTTINSIPIPITNVGAIPNKYLMTVNWNGNWWQGSTNTWPFESGQKINLQIYILGCILSAVNKSSGTDLPPFPPTHYNEIPTFYGRLWADDPTNCIYYAASDPYPIGNTGTYNAANPIHSTPYQRVKNIVIGGTFNNPTFGPKDYPNEIILCPDTIGTATTQPSYRLDFTPKPPNMVITLQWSGTPHQVSYFASSSDATNQIHSFAPLQSSGTLTIDFSQPNIIAQFNQQLFDSSKITLNAWARSVPNFQYTSVVGYSGFPLYGGTGPATGLPNPIPSSGGTSFTQFPLPNDFTISASGSTYPDLTYATSSTSLNNNIFGGRQYNFIPDYTNYLTLHIDPHEGFLPNGLDALWWVSPHTGGQAGDPPGFGQAIFPYFNALGQTSNYDGNIPLVPFSFTITNWINNRFFHQTQGSRNYFYQTYQAPHYMDYDIDFDTTGCKAYNVTITKLTNGTLSYKGKYPSFIKKIPQMLYFQKWKYSIDLEGFGGHANLVATNGTYTLISSPTSAISATNIGYSQVYGIDAVVLNPGISTLNQPDQPNLYKYDMYTTVSVILTNDTTQLTISINYKVLTSQIDLFGTFTLQFDSVINQSTFPGTLIYPPTLTVNFIGLQSIDDVTLI